MESVQKIENEFNYIKEINKFNVLGDPGCDGLGASTMSVFAKALTTSFCDFSLIVGDIVPTGERHFYGNINDFINAISNVPVYMLKGNHDTNYYEDFYGSSNYVIYSNTIKIICLDNVKRDFSDATLAFFKRAMEFKSELSTVISFHIPAPNLIHTNSINPPEWDKLQEIYQPYKSSIKYFIAGHLHSYFEDFCDGIPLIVTGGAGAQIEFVNDKIDQEKAFHHIVSFDVSENGMISHEHIRLDSKKYYKEITNPKIKSSLELSFQNESMAHVRYKIFSEDAYNSGYKNLAKLFKALSDAEYYHAKNHFLVLENSDTLLNYVKESISGEDYEVETMYREFLDYAKCSNSGLASYAFFDALEAEKVHRAMLIVAKKSVANSEDISESNYATCSSCGYTYEGEESPARCPICGAPHDKFEEVTL